MNLNEFPPMQYFSKCQRFIIKLKRKENNDYEKF